jgi:hypothetical protein
MVLCHTPGYHLCMTESGSLDWLVDFEALAFFAADHAVVESRKLYINGGFWHAVLHETFPVRIVGSLAAVIKVPAQEYLEDHRITVELTGPDGENLPFEVNGQFRLGAPPHLNRGDPSIMPLVFPLDGLVLTRAGEYCFILSIDGDELKRCRIRAIQSPPVHQPPEASSGRDDENE